MSIPKCKDFRDYNRYPSDPNPTTDADMQEYMANQNELMKIVAEMLWQPRTYYEAGQRVQSNSLPINTVAVVETAGMSGENEPQWGDVDTSVADGSIVWLVKESNESGGGHIITKELPDYDEAKDDYVYLVDDDGALKAYIKNPAKGKMSAIGDSVPCGTILAFGGTIENIPSGYLACNGASVLRSSFPDLYAKIGTRYGAVDAEHFNLPNANEARYLCGGVSGDYLEAGLPNVEGGIDSDVSDAFTGHIENGALYSQNLMKVVPYHPGSANVATSTLHIDASRSNPIYGNSNTVTPKSVIVVYIIKAFGGADESINDVTATQLSNEIASVSGSVGKKFGADDFTILQVNGGNPIATNSRCVLENPFSGYYVNCVAEIYWEGKWQFSGYRTDTFGNGDRSMGVMAYQKSDNTILVIVGSSYITGIGNGSFSEFSTVGASAPCRVKVWKVGKIQ